MIITPKAEAQPTAPIIGAKTQSRQPDINEAVQPTQSTEEIVEPAKEEPVSPKLALLAQREKRMRAMDLDLKAREDALKAKEEEYKTSYIPKSRLKEDALSALQDAGVSYDQITEALLKQPTSQVDPLIREQQDKIAALEERLSKLSGDFESKQTNEYQSALKQIGKDVTTLVKDNPEYELVDRLDMGQKVVEFIEEKFKEDGTLISIEEAAKAIEDALFEDVNKFAQLNKVKSKFAPQTPEPEKKPINLQTQDKQPTRTLTNAVTASKPLTPRERAIRAFRGELN